jgi:murein DD-endopeptidase MepM/ murein hydrolase activator NlpD
MESIRRSGPGARLCTAGLFVLLTAAFAVPTAGLEAMASAPDVTAVVVPASGTSGVGTLAAGAAPAVAAAAGTPSAGTRPSGAFRAATPAPVEPRAAASPAAAVWAGEAWARPQPRLSWPLSPDPVITKYFDAPETPYGPGHRGVDLAAVPGQEVLAADVGVVVFAGLVAGRPVVSVDHDGGLRTTYEPVAAKVAAGDQVYRGQVLGTVLGGHPGCAVAACLHWGVRRGEEYVDPLSLTGEAREYRLKPWGGGP